MKILAGNIFAYIVSNTVWMFLTMILFISYIFLLDDPSNYIGTFARITLLFAPILIFALLRNWIQSRLPRWAFALSWIFCFLLYPALLTILGSNQWLSTLGFPEIILRVGPIRFLLVIGFLLLTTELALLFNDHLRQWISSVKWLKQLSLEKSILSICLVLAVLLAFTGMIEMWRTPSYSANGFFQLIHFISFLIQFLIIILAYYFFYYCNHYLLIPRLLKEKGFVYYGFSVAATILICYPILLSVIRLLPVVEELSIGIFTNNDLALGADGGGLPFSIMILSAPIIVSNQWFRQNREIAVLEQEKTERELGLLKQQINPHFFFNTLNNLYALSLTRDRSTPEVILQLSELMRYVIYRGKEKTVPLHEEIKYIEDYIQLQLLRLHQELDLCFDKQIEDEMQTVPPLLFIILVENAFKHGIEPAEYKSLLHISLKSSGKELEFSCKNSLEGQSHKQAGIGLQNLRRRLELLFPQRHDLSIRKSGNTFTAVLNLDLT